MTTTLKNFSVSQVETYVDCARKWLFKSILKLPDPPGDSALRGLGVHKGLENTGARLATGASLQDALAGHDDADAPWMTYVGALAHLLPKPGESHAREHRFTLPTHTGIPLIGVIDLILDERNPIEITDWKSTSDVRYAKTPGELLYNLQLAVYAHYVLSKTDDPLVVGRLAYVEVLKKPLKTKPPRTIDAHAHLARDHVRRIWQGELPFGDQTKDLHLPAVLDEMVQIGTTCTDPQDVAPTTTTCTKYGGCPFRTNCGLSPFAGLNASTDHAPKKRILIQESNMGFLTKTAGNGSTQTPKQTPVPQVAAPAPAPAAAAPAKTGFLAKLKAQGGPQASQAAPAPVAAVPTGIVPPDAPPRDSVAQAAQEDAPVEAPKKRGRPKKVEAADAASVDVVEVNGVVVGVFDNADVAPRKAAPKTGRRDFTILIDCITTKGAGGVDATHLDDFFATIEMELNELAAAEENLPSYWLLGFGPQKAALAMKVQERIAKGLPPVMIVRSSSNAAREVLPFLLPHATQVIQSLRG